MNRTAIIILAAGNSSRLGRPKQLLPYKGATLLSHIVTEAVKAGLHPVVVITGAFADDVGAELHDKKIHIIHNTQWQEGMGTSIATGLSALCSLEPGTDAVIIAVCDQPHLSAPLLQTLATTQVETQKGIVACAYSGTIGTPVLFTKTYFSALSALAGNEGAKKILLQHQDDLITIPFPEGHIDIDTPDDYRTLFPTSG